MRVNIPLLPVSLDFGFRPLPPLRLTALIVLAVMAATLFGLRAERGRRAGVLRHHTLKANERPPDPDSSMVPAWIAEASRHRDEAERQAGRLWWIDLAVAACGCAIAGLLAVAGIGRVISWAAGPPHLRGRIRLTTAIVLVGAVAVLLGLARIWQVRATERLLDPVFDMASIPPDRLGDFHKILAVFARHRAEYEFAWKLRFESPTEAKLYYTDGGNHGGGYTEMKKDGEEWAAQGVMAFY